jgi:hypothetical protein
MADFEIVVDLSATGRYIEGFKDKVDRGLAAVAMRTASGASSNTVRVDTGLMKNSWRSQRMGFLDYIAGSFGCDYAIFHELGTRFMSATPMLMPAFAQEWSLFKQTLAAAGMLK